MANPNAARNRRVPTGVPGLDRVLQGGLFRGGVYLVRGEPGAGKTILGNQLCFSHARSGGRATYVTLLAEAHARMMMNLESLSFFDPDMVGGKVQYISGYNELETENLRGVLDLVRRELRARKATLLIIDGLVALKESAATPVELKKFVHELQLHAELMRCTVLLLTGPPQPGVHPENTMVDGIIELCEDLSTRSARTMQVHKFRGDRHLRGAHHFEITKDGIVIYPRIEAVYGDPAKHDTVDERRVSSGISQLDDMLGGGLPSATTTMVMGPSGSGKTTLGLHYIAAAPPKTKAVWFGFYETPQRLLLKAEKLGLGLERRVNRGELEIAWQASTEQSVDQLVERLLSTLERTGAKRLFIDGLDGLQRSTIHPERVHHAFTALANELRIRGVTTMYSYESPQFLGPELKTPLHGISALVENLLLLRFVELRSHLYRLMSIMKVRDSEYDSSLREFRISAKGLRLEKTFQSAESILSGTAQVVVPAPVHEAARRKVRTR